MKIDNILTISVIVSLFSFIVFTFVSYLKIDNDTKLKFNQYEEEFKLLHEEYRKLDSIHNNSQKELMLIKLESKIQDSLLKINTKNLKELEKNTTIKRQQLKIDLNNEVIKIINADSITIDTLRTRYFRLSK
jgi:hypothetical protein